jgi:hypothetical protein
MLNPIKWLRAGDVELVLGNAASFLQNEPKFTLPDQQLCFEAAGVEFIDENGGGAGVRLRKS